MSVDVTQDGAVMSLGLARPAQRNALTDAMFVAMAQALDAAQTRPDVRVVVIHGSATCFTAGYDLQALQAAPPQGQDSAVWRFLSTLANFDKPLLAAPCGPAIGIGTTLLLHCDAVYAGDNARFAMPFAQLGLCPEAAASVLLPALVGWHRAAEYLLFGEAFSAATAHAMGLVNQVLPAEQALEHARRRAAVLAALPGSALRETKRLMRRAHQGAVREALVEEAAVFCRMLQESAAQEALRAHTEKRRADFSGCQAS